MKLVSTQDKTHRDSIDYRTQQRIWQKIQQRMHMQEDLRTQNNPSLTWVIGLIAIVAIVLSIIIYHHLYTKVLFTTPLWLHQLHSHCEEDCGQLAKNIATENNHHPLLL